MKEEVLLASTSLTKTEPAPYARYMNTDTATETKADGLSAKTQPDKTSHHTEANTGIHPVLSSNPKEGLGSLLHAKILGPAVSMPVDEQRVDSERNTSKDEALKKRNILQALWNALLQAFTKGSNFESKGFQDAMSLSIVFSDAVAASPLSGWDKNKLKSGYLNWYKLSQTYAKDPSVQVVANAGMQEIRQAVTSNKDIDLEKFESEVRGYYVENKESITLDSLKKGVIDTEAAKAEEVEKYEYFKEKLTQRTVILPGVIFSPSRELYSITHSQKSHAEREAAIFLFKEKLAYQRIGLTNLRDRLLIDISVDPNIFSEKIDRQIVDYRHHFGFDDYQVEAIAQLTDSYIEKQKKIRELQESCKDEKGNIDSKRVFAEVFGHQPITEVKAEFRPMEVLFIVKDREEYKKALNSSHEGDLKPISAEEKAREEKSEGMLLAKVGGLENMVVIVSTDDKKLEEHEGTHALNRHISPLVEQASGENSSVLKDRLKIADTDEEKRIAADAYNKRILRLRLMGLQDEILAHFKQGMNPEQIKEQLVGLDSNYIIDKQKELQGILEGINKETSEVLSKSFENVFNAYEETVKKGIDALKSLHKAGYSPEQALGILSVVELKDWEKTAERQIFEKKGVEREIDKNVQPSVLQENEPAARESLAKLQEARKRNKGKHAFEADSESLLRKNAAFIAPMEPLIDLDTRPYERRDGVVDNSVVNVMNKLKEKALTTPGGAQTADIDPLRAELDTIIQTIPELKVQALSAKAKIDNLEHTSQLAQQQEVKAEAQQFYEDIGRYETVLIDEGERKRADRVHAAAVVIDKYLHYDPPPDVADTPEGRVKALLEPIIIPNGPAFPSVIEQLQEYVWDLQRNINRGELERIRSSF